MSDLRPTGVAVELEGVERHLLFTLNAIDDIQEHFDMELGQVINNLTDKAYAQDVVRYVLYALLNDEEERTRGKGRELKKYSYKEIGWIITLENQIDITIAILEAYGISLPKTDAEEDDPNQTSGQQEK